MAQLNATSGLLLGVKAVAGGTGRSAAYGWDDGDGWDGIWDSDGWDGDGWDGEDGDDWYGDY